MDKSVEVLSNQLNNTLNSYLQPIFENKYFVGSLYLFVGLYAALLAPKLPNNVLYFFDSLVGKFLFMFLIAFLASRNLPNSMQTALVVAFVFLVGLTTLSNVKLQEQFKNAQSLEDFSVHENFSIRDQVYIPLIETLENEIKELKQ